MKRVRLLLIPLLLFAIASLLGYLYVESEMTVAHTPVSQEPFEIPPGLGARAVLKLLHARGLIGSERLTLIHVVLSGNRKALKAGEYLFDEPVTTDEVIQRLVSGAIYLHKFTVPEGLTVGEVAGKWEEQGFGKAEEFVTAARDSTDLVRDLDVSPQASLEGYLFPETYSFAIRTTPRRAIETMVARFRAVLQQLQQRFPSNSWPLSARDTLILASLVEEEARLDDERPVIASVLMNRLKRKILLQCDPTVIYALEESRRYQGKLTGADLKFDSPYNTYRYPGLPPGPITNPGMRSLEAAALPAASSYLYFVRTTEGRHTFSETLEAHNRAVAAYRAQVRAK